MFLSIRAKGILVQYSPTGEVTQVGSRAMCVETGIFGC